MTKLEKTLINDDISEKIIDITEKIAKENGADKVTVKRILSELNVTNRVFYNRFHNIDDVLLIVYRRAVVNMRKSFKVKYDSKKDFLKYCLDIATNVLVNTYDIKKQFNQYMFVHDSFNEENYKWWMKEINEVFNLAAEKGIIKKMDTEVLSYSTWCFCRGYNADALSRGLSKEEAKKYFQSGFGCFLEGIKK